jgi:hypothetical protein
MKQCSAKPLFSGSNPDAASNQNKRVRPIMLSPFSFFCYDSAGQELQSPLKVSCKEGGVMYFPTKCD